MVGLAAGWVGGIIGTGSSLMLLPMLVCNFGPKQRFQRALDVLMLVSGVSLLWAAVR
jgi:hypothetical protein